MRRLAWIDRQGRQTPLAAPPRGYAYPRISPDGTRIAIDIRDDAHGIWLWDEAAQTLLPFTTGRASDIAPVWSHDGRWILFSRGRGVSPRLLRLRVGGDPSTAEPLPARSNSLLMPTALAPDDRQVVLTTSVATGFDLQAVDLLGDGAPHPLLASSHDELNGDLSPDGRWLAYQSRESGQFEVWVRRMADGATRGWRATGGGGTRPAWTRNGAELAYLTDNGALWSMSVAAGGDRVSFGPPRTLFSADIYTDLIGRTYDVTGDGERFLVVLDARRP